MNNRVKSIKDVVSWNLCVGCGLCLNIGGEAELAEMKHTIKGKRPYLSNNENDSLLANCPGMIVDKSCLEGAVDNRLIMDNNHLLGSYYNIFIGNAIDKNINYSGSSGGILSALSVFCLETGYADYIIQTAMDKNNPLESITVESRSKKEILDCSGSMYVSSSPCEILNRIENRNKKCVFIGKPCDVAAVRSIMKERPILKERIVLLLTFFCAGVPSRIGTEKLLDYIDVNKEEVRTIKYRGEGWPGLFEVVKMDGEKITLTYEESWGKLQKDRQYRCYLCPDGFGELGDISSGDAWGDIQTNSIGLSYIFTRTIFGCKILEEAKKKGFINVDEISADPILQSQKIINKRRMLKGRLLTRKMFCLPNPSFYGFDLDKAWGTIDIFKKIKTIIGTFRRIIARNLWRKYDYYSIFDKLE